MNLTLKQKVLGALLLVGITPFSLLGVEATITASTAIEEQASDKLSAARDIKKAALNRYFDTVERQVKVVADNNMVKKAMFFFQLSYPKFIDESKLAGTDPSTIESSVNGYWTNQFAKEYANQNQSNFDTSVSSQMSKSAKYLQYAFISNNANPLGSKNKLTALNDSSRYAADHKNFHPWFDKFVSEFGYYDLFLVNNKGEVVYSVFKELDYATSLETGPWKNSGLAKSYRNAKALNKDQVSFTDLATYTPSYDAPASFASTPIYRKGKRVGTLILQMPLDKLTEIMSDRSGMGETGETYLVGSDQLMRSDSYLDPKYHSVVASFRNPETGKVNTSASIAAIEGKTATEVIIDYNGNPVLSAYAPITLGGHQWAILAEVDVAEAFAKEQTLMNTILITGVIILLVLVVFGIWLSNTLSRPVVRLAEKMNQVSQEFNFDEKCHITSKDEIGMASEAFNNLLLRTHQAMGDVNNTMVDIANGRFDSRIESNLQGDLGKLKDAVNQSANSVDVTMNALGDVMDAISSGNFKARMSDEVKGEFKTRVDNAMITMDGAISEIGQVIGKLSVGEFDARVTANLQGDLDALKSNINHSLDQLGTAMTEINQVIVAQSNSDLSETVNGDYKGQLGVLKDALNHSARNLNDVITGVVNTAENVSRSSNEVASGSSDLNQRTQSQAASLEETAASMEELTSTIQQNASHAAEADNLSENAKRQAVDGLALMSDSVEAIKEIHDSSAKIEEIIGLIDSIAFQTNLLALNAAVEAARAGEHGRGFAVVAGEVRNLAGKSADAARDIKALIDTTVSTIDEGTNKINQTGESLQSINDAIIKVSDIISEIAAASNEQQRGIEQVNVAVSQIDQTTQQNAALVEETTAASEALNHESENLKKSVSQFNLVKRLN